MLEILVGNWCRFAVKGGGHSRHPDDSNSVGGVTIDLDRMDRVEVAADRASARVGGGATLVQVYSALERYDLSFVGGLVATVGVGGFTLGGGRSALSNRYGWALDNVYEYEVASFTLFIFFDKTQIIEHLTNVYDSRLFSPTAPSPPPPKARIRTSTSRSGAEATTSASSPPSPSALSRKGPCSTPESSTATTRPSKCSTESTTSSRTRSLPAILSWSTARSAMPSRLKVQLCTRPSTRSLLSPELPKLTLCPTW